jgi:hypothetical protein
MTMFFQKTILIIATIILIVMLTFIGISLSKSKYAVSWPPIVGDCPDYWVDLSGNGEHCFNSKSLGICNIPTLEDKNTMNFNIAPYNSYDNGLCAKYKWATDCKVTWDGITTGIDNPCNINPPIEN